MKTPTQELLEWIRANSLNNPRLTRMIEEKTESLLKKEKKIMVDFAYNCRNIMAADEFAISHWYDKTFNSKDK